MISVIIPVYNVESYLFVCLNSVLGQSFKDFEIICIDDTSSDSSLDILKFFAEKDSRIKILENETNMGPGYCRNKGLETANGKYISFIEGNDFLSPNAFEILIKKAENDNLDVLMFKNIVFYDNKNEFGMEPYYDMKFMNRFENQIFTHWDLDKTDLFAVPNDPWNKFYKKSFLDENNIQFSNEKLTLEGDSFFYQILTSAERISIINSYLYNRRINEDSIWGLTNEILFDNIELAKIILDYFIGRPHLYDYYKKEILTYIFNSLFNIKYYQINDNLKEEFYNRVQRACEFIIGKYGLYSDIKENINEEILEFFKFDEIAVEVLSPKISVIISVYNVEKYLRECLDSVLNQTLRSLEIICVNDGSTDNSLSILKEYQNHDSRIKIITKENHGLSSARNAGLNLASGKYVYFIDSDDYIECDALNELYDLAINKDLDMVLFKLISFWDDSKERFISPYLEMAFLKGLVGDNVFSFNDLGSRLYDLAVVVPGVLFKRDLISDLRFPEGLIFEDNVFFYRSSIKS